MTKILSAEELDLVVRGIIENSREIYLNDDGEGNYVGEIYTDYYDELSKSQIKEIVQAEVGEKMQTFYDILQEYVVQCEDYEKNYIFSVIRDAWDKEEHGDFRDYYDMVNDFIRDKIYFIFPYDQFLSTEVNVNIMVDSGDGNYDYTLNNFMAYDGDGIVEDESGLLWLVKQQGYEKSSLIEAIKEESGNRFLDSIVNESANATTHMNALTFFVKMTIKEYIEMEDNQKGIILTSDTNCGLYDPWNGAGSVLDIQCDVDIELPREVIRPHIDGNRGYGLGEIYGMGSDFWRGTVLKFI